MFNLGLGYGDVCFNEPGRGGSGLGMQFGLGWVYMSGLVGGF